jgi:ribosomal protein S18 acetylase RimI-like enzyme
MNISKPVTSDDLHMSAELIYQADQNFYDLFSNSSNESIENILKMYEDENTTFSQVRSVYIDDQIVGAILYYSASEIRMRQMFSLPYLAQGKSFDNNVFREFSEGVPIIDSQGLYLSHMAIDEKYQGKGLCKKSMNILSNLAISDEQEEIVLHVRSANLAALQCYKSSGFVNENKNSENVYIVLKKKLNQ